MPLSDNKLTRPEIFLRYHDFVRFVAMLNAPSPDLIGDIVNDTFVAFIEWENDAPIRNERSLLRQITVNTAKRYWRKELEKMPEGIAKLAEYVRLNLADWETDSDSDDMLEQLTALDSCLQLLPEKCRVLIQEHYVNGKPIVEIAQVTHHKPGVLYNTISRARAALGECIRNVLRRTGHDD